MRRGRDFPFIDRGPVPLAGLVACVAFVSATVVHAQAPAAVTPPVSAKAVAAKVSPEPAPAAAAESNAIPAPRPGDMKAEQAHVQRYDKAIAAVRDHKVEAADLEKLKQAFARITAIDVAGATALRQQIVDPAARKMVDWFRLRGGLGEPAEYREFLAANPAWPNRELMIQRYEEALFTKGGTAKAIRDALGKEPPRTGAGWAALASAHLADGDEAGAARLARTAWREQSLSTAIETAFLERLGKLLTAADHKWRLDMMLMDDPRWSADRTPRVAAARRLVPLLPEAERKRAEARIAVFNRAGNGATLLAAHAAVEDKDDWGLAFQRIQSLRRTGKIEEAAKMLVAAPLDADKIVSPDGWWNERRAIVYEALKAGKPQLAYNVAKAAGPLSINPLKDQQFHAGWLAFTHLKDAKAGAAHFEQFLKASDGPLSRAKAGYWLGRAQEALGRATEAQAAYRESAKSLDTFHGHLSRLKLAKGAPTFTVTPPAAPTADEITRFNGLDAARAAVIASRAKLETGIVRAFLGGLQRHLKSEAELAMVAHLAEALGDTQMAVRIAKAGVARGHNLLVYSYPVHAFPAFTALRLPIPEMALLLAIARQESEFNGQTMSGAGARGILQVMPITARHVCRDYKIKCDIPRLMRDNAYNTQLAAAYIGDRMREFGGSYVLGFAGYNAGPGRARQWMREFGDPRDPAIDPIDWMHRIPFEETREYVQKVMSNVQVYRARLGSGAVPLRIADDLARARGQASQGGGQGEKSAATGAGAASRADAGDPAVKVFE
jgi:soluble lytic murein transglycosylase